jgi:hypothetical protein
MNPDILMENFFREVGDHRSSGKKGRTMHSHKSSCWRATLLAVATFAGSPAAAFGIMDDGMIAAVPGPTPLEVPGSDMPASDGKGAGMAADSRWHGTLALDLSSAYFFRGIRQEDQGLIAQPSATLAFDAVRGENFTWGLDANTWHSVHTEKTLADADATGLVAAWYEGDVTFGTSVKFGSVMLRAAYTFYSSPNDAFKGYEEAVFQIGLDDSSWMGAWALSPVLSYAIETADNGADGASNGHGSYLELAVTPGFEIPSEAFKGRVNFPVVIGLDASDYYENAAGEDSFFGFAEFGARLVFGIPAPEDAGTWSAYIGVRCLYLGEGARELNEQQEEFEVMAVGGISVSF